MRSPDRIWIDPDMHLSSFGLHDGYYSHEPTEGAPEYVRDDIHAAALAALDEAREALVPFAEWGEKWDDGRPGAHRVDSRNLASDIRRARGIVARIDAFRGGAA